MDPSWQRFPAERTRTSDSRLPSSSETDSGAAPSTLSFSGAFTPQYEQGESATRVHIDEWGRQQTASSLRFAAPAPFSGSNPYISAPSEFPGTHPGKSVKESASLMHVNGAAANGAQPRPGPQQAAQQPSMRGGGGGGAGQQAANPIQNYCGISTGGTVAVSSSTAAAATATSAAVPPAHQPQPWGYYPQHHSGEPPLVTGVGAASIETDDSHSATGSDCDRHSFSLGEFSNFTGATGGPGGGGSNTTLYSDGISGGGVPGMPGGGGGFGLPPFTGTNGANLASIGGMYNVHQPQKAHPPQQPSGQFTSWVHNPSRPPSSSSTTTMFFPPPDFGEGHFGYPNHPSVHQPHHRYVNSIEGEQQPPMQFASGDSDSSHQRSSNLYDLENSPPISSQQDNTYLPFPSFVLANSGIAAESNTQQYGSNAHTPADSGDPPNEVPTKPNLTLKPIDVTKISKKKDIPTPSPTTADAASSLVGLGMGMQSTGAAQAASLANAGEDFDDDDDDGQEHDSDRNSMNADDSAREYLSSNYADEYVDDNSSGYGSMSYKQFQGRRTKQVDDKADLSDFPPDERQAVRRHSEPSKVRRERHERQHGDTEGILESIFHRHASAVNSNGEPCMSYEDLNKLASTHGPTLLKSDASAMSSFLTSGGLFKNGTDDLMDLNFFKDHYHLCNRCTSSRKKSNRKPTEVVVAALPEQYEGDLIKCCEHFQWVWCAGYSVTGNSKCIGTHRHQSCPKYLAKCTFWKHKKPPGKINHKRKVPSNGAAKAPKQQRK
eukprot:gb/GECG01007999.1/.p1 GENE.gb/GECG01007999.1/~~gb/GECG01007999.1/.p1  ORF type:complete len:774 (+),score=99.66 gb/GECG01007999.1/:1-2322(+)